MDRQMVRQWKAGKLPGWTQLITQIHRYVCIKNQYVHVLLPWAYRGLPNSMIYSEDTPFWSETPDMSMWPYPVLLFILFNFVIDGDVAVRCLLNIPATYQCISRVDLLRQLYMLPHWHRCCRSNLLSHPVTKYRHRANQSKHGPYNARGPAG